MQVVTLVLLDETIAIDNEQADLADFQIWRMLDIHVLAVMEIRLHRCAVDGNNFIRTVRQPCVPDKHRFTGVFRFQHDTGTGCRLLIVVVDDITSPQSVLPA